MRLPSLPLFICSVGSLLLFIALALWSWGDVEGFFAHPARLAAVAIIGVMLPVGLLSGANLSRGKREDVRSRWVIIPFLGLVIALYSIPVYLDRHDRFTIDGDAVRYLGLLLFAAGGVLRIWPMYVLGHRFSGFVAIQENHTLVTGNVYRFVRHPSYLGFLVAMVGWSLVFRSVVGLVLVLLIIPVLIVRIHAEEALLRSEFGEAYEAYQLGTWCLITYVY